MRGYSGPEHKSLQRLIAQSLIHNKRLSVTRPHSKSPVNQRQLGFAPALIVGLSDQVAITTAKSKKVKHK